MIEVNERIEVPADQQTVWDLLSNPRAVVDCVPGASLGDQHEDGSYDAGVTIKFGPAKVTFKARVSMQFNAATKSGSVASRGKDNQGGTRFNASMNFKVVEQAQGGGSAIEIQSQVEIAGRLASLVESGASMVVKRMTADFSERLVARCAGTA